MVNRDSIAALILAAGKGTRMKSSLPKVLHRIAGQPILEWVMNAVKAVGISDVTVVLSSDLTPFEAFLEEHPRVRIAIQQGQRGTGDAVASAAEAFVGARKPNYADGQLFRGVPSNADWVLIVTGDTPAISAQTLKEFVESTLQSANDLAVLGMDIDNPFGYGRLVRSQAGGLSQITEERDADPETKRLRLCNSGIVMAKTARLFELLSQVMPQNSQKEYYLTDIFSLSAKAGRPAHVFETKGSHEFLGVNDRIQLESLESWLLNKRLGELMQFGVTLHRPHTVYVDESVIIEKDVEIFSGVSILGQSTIRERCQIGPGSVLQDVNLEAGVVVGANSVLTGLKVRASSHIPPGTVRAELDF